MTLPRRANGIRALASDIASTTLVEVAARQAVSDRIGYTISACIGAATFAFGGRGALAILLAYNAVSAFVAYRRWKAISR